jgi:hypothetical protein
MNGLDAPLIRHENEGAGLLLCPMTLSLRAVTRDPLNASQVP